MIWQMPNILPDATGLTVEGVYFRYTTVKDPDSDLIVVIKNEHAEETGYIYYHEDDWSGVPGNTIVGYDSLTPTLGTNWGEGSITTEGEGNVTDPTVRYTYRYDTCNNPLDDPTCPGFEDALYNYILENVLAKKELSVDDPYYDEWVQMQLESKAEVTEESETEPEEDEKEEDLEQKFEPTTNIAELGGVAGTQAEIIAQIAYVPQFGVYYTAAINGGVYNDVITLQDTELPDNGRALRSLASDAVHRNMVRSQYENDN